MKFNLMQRMVCAVTLLLLSSNVMAGAGIKLNVCNGKDIDKLSRQGDATAQYCLAYNYRLKQDYTQAVYWYRKAADQGHISAEFDLGYHYENGYGVFKDLTQARYWYQKAADQGLDDAKLVLTRLSGPGPKPLSSQVTVQGTLYVLAVGVGHFQDSSIPALEYTERDASALSALLQRQKGRVFNNVQVSLLTGKGATLTAVNQAMNTIAQTATSADTVVAYFSTHGGNTDNNYYLFMNDSRPAMIKATSLSGKVIAEFYSKVKSNTLLLVDSAFSGLILKDILAAQPQGAHAQKTVVVASAAWEQAYESTELQQGFFTAALLDALSGKGRPVGQDVRVADILVPMNRQITKSMVQEIGGEKQHVNVAGDLADWVLTRP